ncbi:MAG: hypothetical protein CMF99_01110 [Candidatus Marinimicrobia bacterium]|nr:hypothetical protein [Candidatus Neomarinimicrobiota bacterium]
MPLFIIYEIGLLLSTSEDLSYLRNGADALMRKMLSIFGIAGLFWISGVFLFGFLIIYFFQKYSWNEYEIKSGYFLSMVLESTIWSYVLFILMSNMHVLLMVTNSYRVIQNVTLAIGAGIYEEILFRVILIFLFNYAFALVFRWNKYLNTGISIVFASIFFSLFHFIGEFGDFFSFNIFMIRFLAGIALGILYYFRGFGITAWTHSLYDLIVLTRITIQ